MAQLWALVSELHSAHLDPDRPSWEIHLIEGLVDGRQAVYLKAHRVIVDEHAVTGLLGTCLSTDPCARATAAPWETELLIEEPPVRSASNSGPDGFPAAVIGATKAAVAGAGGILPAVADTLGRKLFRRDAPMPVMPSGSPLYAVRGSSRAVNGGSWSVERLGLVAKATDVGIDDVVLAMCSDGLRRHLAELDALPMEPLVAQVPIHSPHVPGPIPRGGLGALTCSLATHLPDPLARLTAISEGVRARRAALSTHGSTSAVGEITLGALSLALGAITGRDTPLRTPNVRISTVNGPTSPLYWNGAHLAEIYSIPAPITVPALSITAMRNDAQIAFGLVGCHRTTPALGTLLGHLECGLASLEAAVGL